MTEYEKQAADFMEKHKLEMVVQIYPSEAQTAPKWAQGEKHGYRYRVTIRPTIRPIGKRLSFDFWNSIADREKRDAAFGPHARRRHDPGAYDILACISGDQHAPESFADFVAEYGGNIDSIRERKAWKRVRKFARKMSAFFTADQLSELSEIV